MTFPGSSLRDFLTLFSLNRLALSVQPVQQRAAPISRSLKRFQQANPIGKAQQNVSHHYDLGNAFYELFLDRSMFYSCAYFRDDDETLEAAQINKCRLIAAKLNLRPGLKVLDIGSGWGGLARYLARVADVEVLGVTLSREQFALAVERTKAAGLDGSRTLRAAGLSQADDEVRPHRLGRHVRARRRASLQRVFRQGGELMADDGLMLLHSIGHMSPPGTASPWMRKYIFPGAYSPALSEVFPAVESNSLWVTDLEFLRVHYATTLRHWHERFEANREKVAAMYDERFCRMWEFYLISAEMMFRTGSQEVFHMQLAKKRDAAPIVRDYATEMQRRYEQVERERGF